MDDIHLPHNINISTYPHPSYEIKSVRPENMATKTEKSVPTEKANPCIKFSFETDILIHQTPFYNNLWMALLIQKKFRVRMLSPELLLTMTQFAFLKDDRSLWQ
jgi:hypothetical protein